ncbi:MAG: polysaccharide deacetylase family protein [bacterium]|nr:MAG: polysaccharide deacetylase family protein [bacterium]
MKVSVFITIDTEEDNWDEYSRNENRVENIYQLQELQMIFDRFGAVPTYLIDWPVASNDEARRIIVAIMDRGRCEIGTHCHPWNTPPFEGDGNGDIRMLRSLLPEVIERKISKLHHTIVERFGIVPVSFRAGRWATGPAVTRAIEKLGYRIDSSVTPFMDWSGLGGVDFSSAPMDMYRFDPDNIIEIKNNGSLLEVPATIGFLQRDFEQCNRLRNKMLRRPFSWIRAVGILNRLRLLNFRWLSPETTSGKDMIRLAERSIESGNKFLNIFFHSNSLLPGSTTFVRNERQRARLLRRIEYFLRYAESRDFIFKPLRAAVDIKL